MSKRYSYYPNIEDPDFFKKIYDKKEFYMHMILKDTFKHACGKKNLELQDQQKLLRNYISPYSPYSRILVFHGTGVGKTCTAISIAESFKDYLRKNNSKIYLLSSTDARQSFREELLRKFCTKNTYISDKERTRKEYLENLDTLDSRLELKKMNVDIFDRTKKAIQGGFYKAMGYGSFQNKTIGKRKKEEE